MKNPWTISIGSGLILLVVTIIIDAVSAKQIFSTICSIFVAIWNGIVAFLNFDVKVWCILLTVAVIIVALYIALKIYNANQKPNTEDSYITYRQDYILGFKWRWSWGKDFMGKITIDDLYPVCPDCDTPLTLDNDACSYSRQLKCLRCGKIIYEKLPEENHVKLMISDNARKMYFSKNKN